MSNTPEGLEKNPRPNIINVLLLEYNSINKEMYQGIFALEEGFSLSAVNSKEELRARLEEAIQVEDKSSYPHVIILDRNPHEGFSLPAESYDILDWIKAMDPHIKVLSNSNTIMPDTREGQFNFDGILDKLNPINCIWVIENFYE